MVRAHAQHSPLAVRAGAALATAFECLPALMAAWACLRLAEAAHASAAGLQVGTLLGPAFANDVLALLRYGVVLLAAALPLMLLPDRGARIVALGAGWGLLLLVQAALLGYQWTAGVPLGADLFGYSRGEIATVVGHRALAGSGLLPGALAALAVLAVVLWLAARPRWPRMRVRAALVFAALSLACWFALPDHLAPPVAQTEAGVDFLRNKTVYLVDRSLAHLTRAGAAPMVAAPAAGIDPRYPFVHAERTPDTLGPLFATPAGPPPNLVFIIVEGLGRSFSGPGARYGSFTPFLDELAGRGLYFENFLAGQGRTFAVLPTVFGSLPYGDAGMAALGAAMPRHQSLLRILKGQGYRLRYYTGSDPAFDNQGGYLRAEGVDTLVGVHDFKPPAQPSGEWGYDDRALVDLALARERAAPAGPALTIVQTGSTHDPFVFPERARYERQVDARLAALGIAPTANPAYTRQREIFASLLFADDALRRFFDGAARLPGYANTIFIVTGDHRLPELPMDTRIERFHVPLIVWSPLLKHPQMVKAVSSQFDLAPALLAFLDHGYGLRSPPQVTWLGTGLDTAPAFRNLHTIPLKQTKTELSDFVSGTVYLAQGRLYALGDGMRLDRIDDAAALARASAQFDAFLAANRVAGVATALEPPADLDALAGYRAAGRSLRSVALASETGQVSVTGARPAGMDGGDTLVEATFVNDGGATSTPFAPLLVVSDDAGLELVESAGEVRTLAPGAAATVALPARLGRLPHGRYFVSVVPSHPQTGHSIGVGLYHQAMAL